MFVGLLSLSLLSFSAVQSINVYNFIKVYCAEPLVRPNEQNYNGTANSIGGAMDACVNNALCGGFFYNDTDKSYSISRRIYGFLPRPEKFFYMYDKSNGTNLPNAPTWLDSKLIYSIYIGSCPINFTLLGSVCSYENLKGSCAMFPEYTNATYDSNTKTCTVVPIESLIAAWS